jgi:hypothetical protein
MENKESCAFAVVAHIGAEYYKFLPRGSLVQLQTILRFAPG